ncbi:hypothetical protein CRENBAI_021066 [Crenichthys baileyi]|uniref:Uncharacterized protein n=1 Tax=Crenichthys baileyi TaxID=28760 RepID=A0AAV9RLA8_9TELE
MERGSLTSTSLAKSQITGPWVFQSSEHVCTQMFQKHQTAEQEEKEEADEEEEEEGIKERRKEMGGGQGILTGMKSTFTSRPAREAQQGLPTCDLKAVCVSVRSKSTDEQEKSLYRL